jgi:hypothetical protein
MGDKAESDEALKKLVERATADRSHPQGQAYARAGRELHGGLPPEEAQAPRERPEREKRERPPKERERSFDAKIGQAQLSLGPGGVKLDDQRPELRRLRLVSPLKVELDGSEATASFYVHAARDEKGIIHITPMHPFAPGDVIRADVVEGAVLMGPWAIPVSEFAPGSSVVEGPSRLVAAENGVGFKKWKVENDPSLSPPQGYFAGLTKRGAAAIRSKTATNLVWDFEKNPPEKAFPIPLGAAVRFTYGWDGARAYAKDVSLISPPEGDAPAVAEGTPLRQVLFPGVPEPGSEKAEKADKGERADRADPREPRGERTKKEKQETLSPSTAAHLVEAALLRGERGAFEHLSSARTSDRGEQELFEKARWHLASSAGRSSTVTDLVVARANSYRKIQGRRIAEGPAHGLVYLHTLAGEATPLGGKEKSPEDALARALRSAPEYSVAEAVDAFFRRHTVLWDTTIALGDQGYRLIEVDVRRGTTGLVLASPSAEPARLALAFVYEEAFETRERLEAFLKKHQEKKEALAVIATRVGPLHGANTGVLAARYGAAFIYVRNALPENGLADLLAGAKAGAGTVPSPVASFPSSARDLQEAQLVARPEVVTRLLTALDAGRRPVGLYALPRSGRSALAKLAGLQGRDPWFIDFRARGRELTDNPSGLIDEIRGRAPSGGDREYLLVLDGIDFLATALAAVNPAVATQFATAIAETAQSMRVLCLGLDPSALGRLLPGDNPLVDLPRFRLPFPSRSEAKDLVHRMAGALRVDRALEDWVAQQSGGHPGVLRALLQSFVDAQFGKDVPRISTKEPLRHAAALADEITGASGAALRQALLASVLSTREAAAGTVADTWRLATAVFTEFSGATAPDSVLEAGSRLSLGVHPTLALETALDWGILRTTDGQIEAGIPLLRTHVRHEAGTRD